MKDKFIQWGEINGGELVIPADLTRNVKEISAKYLYKIGYFPDFPGTRRKPYVLCHVGDGLLLGPFTEKQLLNKLNKENFIRFKPEWVNKNIMGNIFR